MPYNYEYNITMQRCLNCNEKFTYWLQLSTFSDRVKCKKCGIGHRFNTTSRLLVVTPLPAGIFLSTHLFDGAGPMGFLYGISFAGIAFWLISPFVVKYEVKAQ